MHRGGDRLGVSARAARALKRVDPDQPTLHAMLSPVLAEVEGPFPVLLDIDRGCVAVVQLDPNGSVAHLEGAMVIHACLRRGLLILAPES
jgi:hypothetical protein